MPYFLDKKDSSSSDDEDSTKKEDNIELSNSPQTSQPNSPDIDSVTSDYRYFKPKEEHKRSVTDVYL